VFLTFGCDLPAPIGFVLLVISCILGFIAAQQGSKWWLVVPCTEISLCVFMVYIAYHAT
jgi:hypothetical protein